MFRLNPGNNARIREHAAQARPFCKMIPNQAPQLVLQRSMGPAGGRHRLRFSVHELPQTAIPRVPNEKFRDGHPDRYLGNRAHDFRLARKDGQPTEYLLADASRFVREPEGRIGMPWPVTCGDA
jgi:hypothetical protein